MNASAWFVVGLFVGVLVAVLMYEWDRRQILKASEFWEHRCTQLAKAYEAEWERRQRREH